MLARAAIRAGRRSALPPATARRYAQSSRPPRPPPPKAPKPTPRAAPKAAAAALRAPQAPKVAAAGVAGAAQTGQAVGKEPEAQRQDADEPPAGGVRDAAQRGQAEAENSAPPEVEGESEAKKAEEEVEAEAPKGPLPDLRQGIPSTFFEEFGKKEEVKGEERNGVEKEAAEGGEGVGVGGRSGGRREGEEREYSKEDYETSLDRRRAKLANFLLLAAAGGAVAGAAYFARPFASSEDVPAGLDAGSAVGWGPGSMYARVRARMGNQLGYYTEPSFPKLLPTVPETQRQPFTLVLSLEDLMIHTTWDRKNGYRTAKRPGIDYFIKYLSQYYELVLFTSVPIAMADPVIKKLDPYHFIMWPLGREATKYEKGEYIKDLAYLNRDLSKTLIIDTHAPHVKNQPENAIVLPKWTGDPKDPHTKDLVALIPFLEYVATMGIEDVRPVLRSFEGQDIPSEFIRRENIAREKFQAELAAQKKKGPKFSLLGGLGGSLGIKADKAGGMVLADGQSVSEGLAQGKMLSDQIREQGQKQYEFLEQQIREHGEKWLREEEEEQKKMMDAQMREMKGSALSFFTGGSKKE